MEFSMEFSPRRGRKPPTPTPPPPPPAKSSDNIFSTFIIHNDGGGEHLSGDDIDDDSLPPLLKRLPKDFGGSGSFDFDAETSDDISGTFIVKPDHHRSYQYSSMAPPHSVRRSRNPAFSSSSSRTEVNPRSIKPNDNNNNNDDDDDDDDGDFGTFVVKKGRNEVVDDDDEEDEDEEDEEEGEEFGTFVVRKTAKKKKREKESEEVSGTFVRKASGSGGGSGVGSTMSRAVASMQAVGELGFGGRNKRSGGGGSGQLEDGSGQVRQLQSKMSSSSIPECIAREDPSSKYELLHELGEFPC